MNLSYWREHQLKDQLLQFIAHHYEKLDFWDQDALNAVLGNQTYIVDKKWNCITHYYNNNEEILEEAIIHFTGSGPSKPWSRYGTHPRRQLYFKYLMQTPWRYQFLFSKDVFFHLDTLLKCRNAF